jgi:hypothetical protein
MDLLERQPETLTPEQSEIGAEGPEIPRAVSGDGGVAGFVWFVSLFAIYMFVQMVFFPNQGVAPT